MKVLVTENHRLVQKHQFHGAKVTVWCGIHANGISDPHYFDNETVRDQVIRYHKTIRPERTVHPRIQVIVSDLFLIQYLLILGSESIDLRNGL